MTLGVVLLGAACSSEPSSEGTEAIQPILTVRSDTVEVNGSAEAPATTTNVEAGDRVQVTDDNGRGTLLLPGLVEFELFKGTNLLVPDPTEEPESVLAVELDGGHLLVSADPDSGGQIELKAGNRTLTTVEDGTSYVVCQAPNGSTCLYVIEGEVEWSDDVDVANYVTGEGTFAEVDQGPQPARCDKDNTVDPWLEAARAGQAEGTLSAQVATLLEGSCPASVTTTTTTESTTTTTTGAALPSAVGMVPVSIQDPVIGTENSADPEHYRELVALDGPITFNVDERPVTNREFRGWVVDVAKNDPEEWKRLVPNSWLEGVEGVETQASYPSGDHDVAVVGIRWGTADAYCRGVDKHLVTEIEWELAAVNGYLQDLEAERQDWVAEPGEYGDEPLEGERMKRGNNNTHQLDPFYRSSVVDTAESTATRRRARIRCAASEVQGGPALIVGFPTEEYADDFTSLAGGWPETEDELFSLHYHDPEVYGLAPLQQHTRGAVLRDASRTLDEVVVAAEVFIERSRMGEVAGNYRFGVTAGSPEAGFVLFTVQPDEAAGDRLDWCLSMMSDRLKTMFADVNRAWFQGPNTDERHEGEFCLGGLDSGTIDVARIDDHVVMTMRLSTDGVVVALNGREEGTADVSVSVDAYGFFAQTYHKDTAHIHFDEVRVTVPD